MSYTGNEPETIKELQAQIKAKDKWISELLKKVECPRCGSTELICGHNSEKGCCTKDLGIGEGE